MYIPDKPCTSILGHTLISLDTVSKHTICIYLISPVHPFRVMAATNISNHLVVLHNFAPILNILQILKMSVCMRFVGTLYSSEGIISILTTF